MEDTLKFIDDVIAEYNERMKSQPYQINLLEEVHMHDKDGAEELLQMKENAHSRILQRILSFRNNRDPVLLKSFINYISRLYPDKLWHIIDIDDPKELRTEAATEDGRIDLFIEEPGKYALIFENKINLSEWGDQPNQLARYILYENNCGYEEGQIFIVYLTSDGHDPSKQSWTDPNNKDNCFRERFLQRYANISFKKHIIDWIKNHAIPLVKEIKKEPLLESALIQYVHYLENKYKQGDIDMQKKEILTNLLGLNTLSNNDEKLSIINAKLNKVIDIQKDINDLVKQLLLDKYSNIKQKYPHLSVVEANKYKEIGAESIEAAFMFSYKSDVYFVVLYKYQKGKALHCGVFPPGKKKELPNDLCAYFAFLNKAKNRLYSNKLSGYSDEMIEKVLSTANKIATPQ